MKTYKKLPLPADSVWERKTWRKYIHRKIKYLIDGVHNIIRWIPFLFHDRDWDDYYILKMLQKKIEHQRNYLVNSNRHTRIDEDNYWMTVALNLLEREMESYYSTEQYNYMNVQVIFKPSEYKADCYEMERKIKSEHLDDYLTKYKGIVRRIMKSNKDLTFGNAEKLTFHVAKYNQERCRNLLFNILKNYSNRWWD